MCLLLCISCNKDKEYWHEKMLKFEKYVKESDKDLKKLKPHYAKASGTVKRDIKDTIKQIKKTRAKFKKRYDEARKKWLSMGGGSSSTKNQKRIKRRYETMLRKKAQLKGKIDKEETSIKELKERLKSASGYGNRKTGLIKGIESKKKNITKYEDQIEQIDKKIVELKDQLP